MRSIFRAVAAGLLLLALASQSLAQTTLLSEFLESNFKSSLIILEGDRWIDNDVDALTKIAGGTGLARQKLAQIAELSDYAVEVYDGGYLLRKRYTDGQELPCISRAEVVAYGEDAKRAVDAVFGTTGDETLPHIQQIVDSLTAEQWERIQQDKLPVPELSAQARQALDGLLIDMFHDGIRSYIEDFLRGSRKLPDGTLWQDEDKTVRLRPAETRAVGAAGHAEMLFTPSAVATKPQSDGASLKNASFGASDLQSVLTRLNARKDGSDDGLMFACTKEIRQTPVYVVGLNKARSPRIVRFIARLYDLELNGSGRTAKMSRKPIAAGEGMSLGPRLAQGLPSALRRALKQRRYANASATLLSPLVARLEKNPPDTIRVDALPQLQQSAVTLSLFHRLSGEIIAMSGGLSKSMRDDKTLHLRCRTKGTFVHFIFFIERDSKFFDAPAVAIKGSVYRKE